MILIDTHAHLYAEDFAEDTDSMIQRALMAGVQRICLPNIDSSTTNLMLDLAARKPELFLPMMGLHPCSVKEDTYLSELEHVHLMLQKQTFIAVGEIGMDLHWDKTTEAIQADAFVQQCKWAVEFDLPIVIHSRNATQEILSLLKEHDFKGLCGVFHCFGDGIDLAKEIIDLGFYLGIGGVLTFKNSGLSEVVEHIDLKHLVLETDAPYLAPAPYRGKRNESSYVKLVAQKLSEVKRCSFQEIAEITSQNAKELFRIA